MYCSECFMLLVHTVTVLGIISVNIVLKVASSVPVLSSLLNLSTIVIISHSTLSSYIILWSTPSSYAINFVIATIFELPIVSMYMMLSSANSIISNLAIYMDWCFSSFFIYSIELNDYLKWWRWVCDVYAETLFNFNNTFYYSVYSLFI